MIIQNASVYCEDGVFRDMGVSVKGDHISELIYTESADLPQEEVIDGAGCYLIPGLVDIHLHGCSGADYCKLADPAVDPHALLDRICAYEAQNGITTIYPASMTLRKEQLLQIGQKTAAYTANVSACGAELAGIYLEGPFISGEKAGAQDVHCIQEANVEWMRELQCAAEHKIRFAALAPEGKGALDFAAKMKEECVLTAAHTNADYETAKAGFAAGISQVTHLYNAMSGMTHRSPGVVGAAADEESVRAELICDGIHVHPAVVRQTFKMFGADRIIFISDSMEATGMPDGQYRLGGQNVIKQGRIATLEDGVTLAGSVSNLMDCLRTAVLDVHIPLEDAVKCASENPAKAAGIFDRCGSISSGKKADMVLLEKDSLEIREVILRGRMLEK